jgi:hypothetical protein
MKRGRFAYTERRGQLGDKPPAPVAIRSSLRQHRHALGLMGLAVRFNDRISNLTAYDASPSVEAKRSGSLTNILEPLFHHQPFTTGTFHRNPPTLTVMVLRLYPPLLIGKQRRGLRSPEGHDGSSLDFPDGPTISIAVLAYSRRPAGTGCQLFLGLTLVSDLFPVKFFRANRLSRLGHRVQSKRASSAPYSQLLGAMAYA